MNNNMLFLVAAVAAVLVMNKKSRAATPAPSAATVAATSPTATNLNNQLWANVLGGAWNSLVGSGGSTSPFLMRDSAGRVVTSDGKPIDQAYTDLSNVISTGGYGDVDVAAPDGTNWLGTLGW